jgi:hypothetical protein
MMEDMYEKRSNYYTASYTFIFFLNGLLIMNRAVFNFKNMMDMHKGYAYQIYNFDFSKKPKRVKPYNLTFKIKTNMNKT